MILYSEESDMTCLFFAIRTIEWQMQVRKSNLAIHDPDRGTESLFRPALRLVLNGDKIATPYDGRSEGWKEWIFPVPD